MIEGPAVRIRRAEPGEAGRLREIVVAAKGHWGYADDWLAAWAELLPLSPQFVRDHLFYVAAEGPTIVGFYSLALDGDLAVLHDLWVIPWRMGAGVGRALFAHACRQAVAADAERLQLEADPHAVGFYRRMGARHLRDEPSEMEGPLPILGLELRATAESRADVSGG